METIGNTSSNGYENQDYELLSKVDKCIHTLSACKKSDSAKYMTELAESICEYFKIEKTDQPLDALFDQLLSQNEKRFIAVCLLRVLAVNEFYFQQERDFRIRAINLFDATFIDDFYKELGITVKQQTHEKQSRLMDVVSKAEATFSDALNSLTGFDRLEDFREQYMRTVNSPLVKNIILPFASKQLIHKSRLSELFESIRQYRQASATNARENYQDACRVLIEFLDEARLVQTRYTDLYVVSMVERLESLLNRDFLSSDLGQPAQLEIKPVDKRYPLHQKDQSLKVGFSLSNVGPGYAYNVEIICWGNQDITFPRGEVKLGGLETGVATIEFNAKMLNVTESTTIEVGVLWENADNTKQEKIHTFNLQGQRTDVDWEALETEDPYSLEPVESIEQLVGRKEIINNMVKQATSRSAGSSYVYGQKRVGKTSIAKAIRSRLAKRDNYKVIYLEGGEYIDPDPQRTIAQLGEKICKKIKSDERFSDIPIPEFKNAISPLTDFLDTVSERKSNLRIIFVLDEFDELPIQLYKRNELADSFFLTLRTISGHPQFGLTLVGGEKMEFIMSAQGDALNKFLVIPVDYFDKESQWLDFQELVRNPTKDWLEITDQAILYLYEQTAGNPYYTMFVCRELFTMMVERKDCYVTEREIAEATAIALKKIASNGFQHFWEDGIFEVTGDRVEEISMRRRRVLLAIANVLREKNKVPREDIALQSIVAMHKDFIDNDLRRFVERRVLVEDKGFYDCKVPFFKSWLINDGVREILTTFTDLDAILERKKRDEDAYVRPEEVVSLVSRWQTSLYQGEKINEERIRAWLNQFGEYSNQRYMFRILQGLKFYSDDELRSKMKEAHGIVTRGLGRYIKYKQKKRGDIAISYLDGIGRSGGGRFSKLYADENDIYVGNVIESSRISTFIQREADVKTLVFLDDFIGSGKSLEKQLRKLLEDHGDVLRKQNLNLFYIAVAGFQQGQKMIEEYVSELQLPLKIHVCDSLDESDKCFSKSSRYFPDEQERLQAQEIAQEFGRQLVRENSLGFGDCQSAVVFTDNCPNNNLPILWAETSTWRPLFKRVTR